MPDKFGLDGIVYASKALSVHGNIVDKFWFKFQKGKVVNFDAKVGKETLASLLKTDEGSCRTGEIALVPTDSPINLSNILFFSTLYDENAACHIALGASYPNNIANGTNLSRKELSQLGSNDSLIHTDFMFGTNDIDIVGYKGKKATVIFKKGKLLI
jgi:aminopeptidase